MQTRRILTGILMFLIKLLFAAVIAVGIYHLGEYAYYFGHSLYDNVSVSDPPGRDAAVVIPEGSSVGQVAELLEARGLIRDAKVFCVQERLSRYHGQMKAGDYVLNTSQNAAEMLAVLSGNEEDLSENEDDE